MLPIEDCASAHAKKRRKLGLGEVEPEASGFEVSGFHFNSIVNNVLMVNLELQQRGKRYVVARNGITWNFPSFREAAALLRDDDQGTINCQVDGKAAWKMAKAIDKWTRTEGGISKDIDAAKVQRLIDMVDR